MDSVDRDLAMLTAPQRFKERFWNRVRGNPGECWNWPLTVVKGYGQTSFRHEGRMVLCYSHRVAYVLAKGVVPIGLQVMHECHNRLCCNPDHLAAGTALENVHQSIAVGRFPKGETAGSSRLSNGDAEEIRKRANSGESNRQIAKAFGVSHTTVNAIVRGERYAA